MTREGAIAANRFGLGARPGEIEQASQDPKAWLLEANSPVNHCRPIFPCLSATGELVSASGTEHRQARQAKDRDAIKHS